MSELLIDLKNYNWLTPSSRKYMSRGYLAENQTPEERIQIIAETAERYLVEMALENGTDPLKFHGFADRFERYMRNGWISLASPVWNNFGNKRGLPISCNGSFMDDSIENILYTVGEIGTMTKMGAGTSCYIGAIRPLGAPISIGGTADGPNRFAELIETTTQVVNQAQVRRGHCAIYLDAEHPDILEMLRYQDKDHPIQRSSFGVCLSDRFMQLVVSRDPRDNTPERKHARKVWMTILKKKKETGYPYLFFTDTANRNAPQAFRDQNLKIWASNMCTEIFLPSDKDNSFVCCLSSVNVYAWDEWRNTDLIETMTMFLDTVIEEYIRKTRGMRFMERAHNFARRFRAVGLGVFGWQTLLHEKMLPFESFEARKLNVQIHKFMDERSLAASREMATAFGEPEVMRGYGERNATRLAIAPTTSSSFICGGGTILPSIEPALSNYYTNDMQKGKFPYKSPHLERVLERYDRNDKETWKSILVRDGSVQHLTFLTDHERAVFKTFGEIPQIAIIQQAADRQRFIDQGQSINVRIHRDTHPRDVSQLYIQAWRLGLKSIYYQRGTNPSQEFNQQLASCAACEA